MKRIVGSFKTHHCRPLQVAVGVIKNSAGEVLISYRNAKQHQGGLWEFPGGKVEATETIEQALARELQEEVGITVITVKPLITLKHQYPDVAVQLNVFLVEHYEGDAKSGEGQPIQWIAVDNLIHYSFPAANRAIITAARLPPYYAILDDADACSLMDHLHVLLNKGVTLIQARLKTLPDESVADFLKHALPLCRSYKATLFLNSSATNTVNISVDGVHLTSQDLMRCENRPAFQGWVAASCHNLEELRHAQKIGVDFVVLAPVLATPTHPEAPVLGWTKFSELVAEINLPVYALGGMVASDLVTAQQSGGQGIAAIRAFLG